MEPLVLVIETLLSTTSILGALWYMTKIFIAHKKESDAWKKEHSERLAKLEGMVTEISKKE